VDVVTDEDPIGINTDGVCIHSGCSVTKAEHEVRFSIGFWVVLDVLF
jgi:hypothetical protein